MSKGPHHGLTTSERFWSHVDKTPTCWLWTGKLSPTGYAQFRSGGRGSPLVGVHRWAFMEAYDVVLPAGAGREQLDHLCRVRHCVRPSHLELVTLRENLERGIGTLNVAANVAARRR